MDEDEFNDFEEASPAHDCPPPPPQEEIPEPSPQPLSAQPPAETSLPDLSIQPSYSMANNFPSELSTGMESQGWEGSAWPGLGKMESDHLAEGGHMQVDFSKRKSEGEIQHQAPDYPNAPELTGVSNQMESNLSNAGTLNSQTLDDFDWGNSPAKDPEDNHSNPSNPIDKKQDIMLAFQQPEPAIPEQKLIFESNPPMEQPKPTNDEDQFNDFAESEARKESDEFVEATVAVETQPQSEVNPPTEQILEPTFIEAADDFVKAEVVEETEVIEKQAEVIQVQQPQPIYTNGVVQVKETEPEKAAENIQPEEDDDDEFGDFEETVPTNSKEPTAEMGPVVDHSPPQMGHPDDKVEIYPQKMGLEGDLGQKQQQLQQFVDSLPDYSFLLAEAFSSM